MKFRVSRDVLQTECKWLKRDIKKGEVLYLYEKATYNSISKNGLPFTEQSNTNPFFELPKDAVAELKE
jgi:hypothetical protein